jgi:hypothetical protein
VRKSSKNRKEFACIVDRHSFIFINMKEREVSFIPGGNCNALLDACIVNVDARARGYPGAR